MSETSGVVALLLLRRYHLNSPVYDIVGLTEQGDGRVDRMHFMYRIRAPLCLILHDSGMQLICTGPSCTLPLGIL